MDRSCNTKAHLRRAPRTALRQPVAPAALGAGAEVHDLAPTASSSSGTVPSPDHDLRPLWQLVDIWSIVSAVREEDQEGTGRNLEPSEQQQEEDNSSSAEEGGY